MVEQVAEGYTDPALFTFVTTTFRGGLMMAASAAPAARHQKNLCSGRAIRVMIVDDHKCVRDGIKAVIMQESGIQVVGEATNGVEAIEAARALAPDVILMDVMMPKMGGMEATRRLSIEIPSARILILSQHDEEPYKQQARAFGAAGYVTKDLIVPRLHLAICTVAGGGEVF